MELLRTLKLPIQAAKFAGHQLLGGAWGELPPLLPTRAVRVPTRAIRAANIQYFSTSEVPDNIELGNE